MSPSLLMTAWLIAAPLQELASFEGNINFYATGNTLGEPFPTTPFDGLACRMSENSVTVPAGLFSARATLLKAYLYYTGNLFTKNSDPGPVDPNRDIDKVVALKLPGQAAPISLSPEKLHLASFQDGLLGGSPRTSYFFSGRIDLTEAMLANPTVSGTYVFSGFDSRICQDEEQTCDPAAPGTRACSSPYLVATASFFMIFVYSDPALPVRATKLFDGLELIDSTTPPRVLSLSGLNVSPIPRGQLTLYAIEGDVNQTGDSGTVSAGGRSAVALGHPVTVLPTPPIACGDPSLPNWESNLMDSTIAADASAPSMYQCVRGVDIDSFDLSGVLQPGDQQVNVTVQSTGTDRFGIVSAIAGIDVFRPVLNVDSRKQVLGAFASGVEPKTRLVYRIGISNTGNIPATGVVVTDDLPKGVSGFEMLKIPPGSENASNPSGGVNGTGHIEVRNITVKPGDIYEVRYSVLVACPIADGVALQNGAVIHDSAEGAKGATLLAPVVRVRDPGGDICAGRKQPGESDPVPPVLLQRKLRGGAGCSAAVPSGSGSEAREANDLTASLLPWLALAGFFLGARRRRLWLASAALVALSIGQACTCSRVVPPPVVPPVGETPPVLPIAPQPPPSTLPGAACPSAPEMVDLGNAACIDRYEAVLVGELGDADQSAAPNGSTLAVATLAVATQSYASLPSSEVSFYQAKAACQNAGKRLCTRAEWERACRGTQLSLYPYGDSFVAKNCNGFDAELGEVVQSGAMTECASPLGAFDLSGNLAEWIDADLPLVGGQGKQLKGGSFVSNLSGLACSSELGADPRTQAERAGVRCCK